MNTIFNEDNIETLQKLNDDYIDLTITSPPYNVDLGNNKNNKNSYDLYNDNKEHKQYIQWLKNIFSLVYQKTKEGGRCVINVGDGKNGRIPTHSDIIQMMIDIGWLPFTTIIWEKNNVSSRTCWGSFKSPSSPSFPTPFEYILVFSKKDTKLKTKGYTDLTSEEFINWSLAKWNISGEKSNKLGHPAPFPVELPLRCIKMFSWIDAVVYDPFMGSGTTAIACVKTNRKYIGSEISKPYYDISIERLNNELDVGIKPIF